MLDPKVVVTGLGVVAPGASTVSDFLELIRSGSSAVRHIPQMEDMGFQCHVGAVAEISQAREEEWYEYYDLPMASNFIQLACVAGVEAWQNSGLTLPAADSEEVDWETGLVLGSGFGGLDVVGERIIPFTNDSKIKRIGSFGVQHTMGSGAAAQLSSMLGIGNQVTANSSACCTGTEAILEGFYKIRSGLAKRMLVGSVEGFSPYVWAQFDAARVLNRRFNDRPEQASRPMSESARGFIPASGAGVLVLETLESAQERGATIYGEILGGTINSGGQRNGGSMTFPNPEGVIRCIQETMRRADVKAEEVDLISGHLTATKADPLEVANWKNALGLEKEAFPYINSPKSIFGHALAGAGGIESVACLLQLFHGFIHPSINCEDVHPEIKTLISEDSIPYQRVETTNLHTILKASFGFGDINSIIAFRRWL